ncbi:holo-ACP synthase [Nocardia sp. CC227C]|uniref:holo-ACP synthase n=1 Tax=Nocardia sp. CC227C TaxID=3044562 RepID=UPI00278C2E5C|nr:holo-ACP synthase [Nocardia sp. CC227C]
MTAGRVETIPGSRSRVSVGVDIAAVERVRTLLSDQPALAVEIFTERELAYAHGRRRRAEHLAARFAAKEAVVKAFGAGMPWRDIEVVNSTSGRPRLRLSGVAATAAAARGVEAMDVSLSHSGGFAIAVVVFTISEEEST